MLALVVGILFIVFAVFSVLPAPMGWWPDVINFLKGAVPVLAVLIGLVAVFIGVADLKDRAEAKKEEEEEAKAKTEKKE